MSFSFALALLTLLAAVTWGWAAATARAWRGEQQQTEKFIHSLRAGNTDPLSFH